MTVLNEEVFKRSRRIVCVDHDVDIKIMGRCYGLLQLGSNLPPILYPRMGE